MAFHFKKCGIPDVVYVEPDIYRDNRGYFSEVYKLNDFKGNGIEKTFKQVNHASSKKNILRGLHYQTNPAAQGKLVSVVAGEIFDVAVDIRKGSPYYGKWVGVKLNAQAKNMLYVPEGFAHGLCILSEAAEVIYYCTEVYSPEHERSLIWNDPEIAIAWPIENPILSEKDTKSPALSQAENNFTY